MPELNGYEIVISTIFENHYEKGVTEFEVERSEMETLAHRLALRLQEDCRIPADVASTARGGKEWIIEQIGTVKFRFKLDRIVPRNDRFAIKVPDALPASISRLALNDEQALLANIRYNRLVDLFLGITTYSRQNHLRTTIKGIGEVEIGEVYVGINPRGRHFVVPIQANGGSRNLIAIQTNQNLTYCKQKFPNLTCRPISAQFVSDDVIAMFDLTFERGEIKIFDERHYRLALSDQM